MSYAALQPAGVKRDVLFVYDLRLPPAFVPTPQALPPTVQLSTIRKSGLCNVPASTDGRCLLVRASPWAAVARLRLCSSCSVL